MARRAFSNIHPTAGLPWKNIFARTAERSCSAKIQAAVYSVRAGHVEQTELIQPGVNVYMSSKIDPVDPGLKGFDKMPG